MTASVSQRLGAFAADLDLSAIPEEAIAHTRLLVLDSVVCAALGQTRDEVARLARTLARTESGTVEAWGGGPRLSAPSAAMVEATAIHAFELDDIAIGQHYGASVLPPALAVASGDEDGGRLVTALVAGCEVAARIQAVVGRAPHSDIGFHGPSVIGTFASAVAAAKMLGLGAAGIADALGHAAQQAAGLMATQTGGMGKRLLAGVSARNGTFAALLAAEGFTSGPDMLERAYGGFFPAISGNRDTWDPARAFAEPARWATLDTRFKMWACRFPIHPVLEGLRDLRESDGLDADDVARVEVELDPAAVKAVGFPWTPSSTASAQMNLSICVASYLLDGDVFLPQFTPDALARPELLELAGRVVVSETTDGGLFKREAPVRVILRGGRELSTIGRVRGGSDDPLTPTLVRQKAERITSTLGIGPDFIAGLGWEHLERLPDIAGLKQHLGAERIRR